MKFPVLPRQLLRPVTWMRAGIALVAVLLTLWSQWLPAGTESVIGNEWLRDIFVRAQASAAPETRLVVIDIDESSLAANGPWPWPRDLVATLIEQLLGPYQARGVALDLVFPETKDAAGDVRLGMLAEHGPLVLAQALTFDKAVSLRLGQIAAGSPAARGPAPVAASGFVANHAGLGRAAFTGNIGIVPDKDGMIRRLPMQTRFEGRDYPTLSLALLECCGAPDLVRALRTAHGPTGGLSEGVGGGADLRRIPYRRQWEAYTVVPADEILKLRQPDSLISGKLVLIGSSALTLSDRVATPLSASTSGLLVHAAALTGLLDAAEGSAPAPWPGRAIALGYTLLVTLLVTYTFPRMSAALNTTLLLAGSLLWLALASQICRHDAVFCSTGPLLPTLFLLAVGVPFTWQMAQRQSRQLLGTLRQYVADAVVDELLRLNLSDPLAPSQRDITTLIADMQGYTGHVESLPVEQAAELTRDFLNCLTRPVLEQHGTLDKFTGDGLVAFWGAPLPIADHADLALDAALAIIVEMRAFNHARMLQGQAPVRVRIGIESGVAMAGDFGSRSRSIYTAVGDSVNVASRLETAARDLPYDVIIGPGTASRTERHQLLCLGETMLRGKEKNTTLYTLAALAPHKADA